MSNNGESIEKTSKIAAIVVAVASVIGGILTGGLMGAIAGLLTGGAFAFAVIVIGGACADVVKTSERVSETTQDAINRVAAFEKTFENFDSDMRYILPEIKEEIADIKDKVSKIGVAAPAPEKKEEAPESTPAPAATPVATVTPEAPEASAIKTVKVVSETKETEEVKESSIKKISFTPAPAPVAEKKEEKKSPFASPAPMKESDNNAPSPFAAKKEESKPATKKGSLYRCEVCGNMVNATPCPRCAIKNRSAANAVKEEAPQEEKSEKSAIWANATKPVSASELAANKSSAFKKAPADVENIPEVEPEKVAETAAPAEEPKAEVVNRASSPFGGSRPAPKTEAPAPATPAKRGSLYRCEVCGGMVNSTPCPKCAIRAKRAEKAAEGDKANAPAEEKPAKEENEDVNPIWAAATKPDSGFSGESSGVKLMESSNSALAQPTWASPLKAGATATEAPSWARPSAAVNTPAEPAEDIAEAEAPKTSFNSSFNSSPAPAAKPVEEKPRPIWEVAAEKKASGSTGPNWMQNNNI